MTDSTISAGPEPSVRADRGRSPSLQLNFLDGLRGLSAVYMAAYHAFLFTGHTGDAQRRLPVIGWFLLYGYLGVPIFIVLSGFVLMLPVVSRGGGFQLPGGAR